jgi:predicted ATPase
MDSITYAGRRKGEPKVELFIDLDDMTYEVCLGTLARGGPTAGIAFPLDPVLVREQILLPGKGKRRVDLLDRAGTTAFVRDEEGNRTTFPAELHPSESVLAQLIDARQYPELAYVRQTLRQMLFHHQLRTDDDAPARKPALGTRTLAVADDGSDLAAALQTIQQDGDGQRLAECVDRAFGGASVLISADQSGRLEVGLSTPSLMRPLSSGELSDGQLRFLYLAAALLSLRPPVLVVLNEPESSLHADLLPALADLIGSAAENTQVVVTTHSNALADALLDHHDRAGVRLELVAGRTTVQPL